MWYQSQVSESLLAVGRLGVRYEDTDLYVIFCCLRCIYEGYLRANLTRCSEVVHVPLLELS